ncbi:MAG: MFS transporter [Defluviitaleaceae bacterium]|nr:MFS transporter [Defluviitaleaceae bacterium]MCL2262786.1 MFS transporter [Defluviitaleaceae bacterium]
MREMIFFLINLKGNAKAAILSQPLWGIPFNLFTPFATLYMFHMGVTDIQIGIMLAAGRVAQMVMSFFGGVITDKFGRRLTSLVGDIVSWSIPALIWAFAQDFRWFLAAAVVNSVIQVTGVAWECLWVDEIGDDGAKITQIYNWLHVCGVLAVFVVPIAGFLVGQYSLVPVVRVLYGFAFVSMTAKAVLLYAFSRETPRGRERMKETKNTPFLQMFAGYRLVFAQIFRSGKMLRALGLQALQNVTIMITTTFFALYTTQNLGLSESFLAYFPILRALVMLVFLFLVQNLLNKFKPHSVMLCGILAYVVANAILLVAPPSNIFWLAGYTFIEACAVALLMPRLSALTANAIEPKERARIRSLFNAAILAFVSPFAYLAGVLSDMNRRLPFVLNIILFAAMLVAVLLDLKSRGTPSPEPPARG